MVEILLRAYSALERGEKRGVCGDNGQFDQREYVVRKCRHGQEASKQVGRPTKKQP